MWWLHWSLVMTAPPPGPDSVWLLAPACSPRCPRPGPAPAEPGLHTARTAHAQTLHYWHPALQHSTLTHLWQNWDQGDNRSQGFRYIGFTHGPQPPQPNVPILCTWLATTEHHCDQCHWWGLVSGSQQWEWSPATTGHHATAAGLSSAGCRIKLIFSSD